MPYFVEFKTCPLSRKSGPQYLPSFHMLKVRSSAELVNCCPYRLRQALENSSHFFFFFFFSMTAECGRCVCDKH